MEKIDVSNRIIKSIFHVTSSTKCIATSDKKTQIKTKTYEHQDP